MLIIPTAKPCEPTPGELKLLAMKKEAWALKKEKPGLRHYEALNIVAATHGYASFQLARAALLRETLSA